MDSLIFAIGKCSSLKAALLPDLLTAATWYLLRLRTITALFAVIYGIVRQ